MLLWLAFISLPVTNARCLLTSSRIEPNTFVNCCTDQKSVVVYDYIFFVCLSLCVTHMHVDSTCQLWPRDSQTFKGTVRHLRNILLSHFHIFVPTIYSIIKNVHIIQ